MHKKFSQKSWLRASLAAMMLTGAAIFAPADLPMAPVRVFAAQQQIQHIGDIQGEGHFSPYAGKKVKDIRGVITFRSSDKVFYIQDEGDGNDKTSDAVMVYAPNTSAGIGDLISIDGEVVEFYGPGYKGKEEDRKSVV